MYINNKWNLHRKVLKKNELNVSFYKLKSSLPEVLPLYRYPLDKVLRNIRTFYKWRMRFQEELSRSENVCASTFLL